MPRLTEYKSQETSKHLSYSLLDSDGRMLFAADLYGGDDLAIAWPTEITQGDFYAICQYYSDVKGAEDLEILIRLAGVSKPITLVAPDVTGVEEAIFKNDQGRKISLIKVVCGQNIFWHDSSSLYSFENPAEAEEAVTAKVAVSIGHKDQLKQLTRLYLATTTYGCAPADARRTLQNIPHGGCTMSVQIEILSSREALAYVTLTRIQGPTPTVEIDLCCLTWDYCEVPGTWQLSFDGDPVVVPVFPGSVNQGTFWL